MEDINISLGRIEYVTSEMALKLYTQGCRVKCPGCNNKDSWKFTKGKIDLKDLKKRIEKFDIAINKIIITGGEPLQQNLTQILKLLKFLKQFDKEIWLITSFEMYEIYHRIREHSDYIKTGIYDPLSQGRREEYGYILTSKNQKIWKKGIHY